MLHLHKECVIHRDLAARNILLTKHLVIFSSFSPNFWWKFWESSGSKSFWFRSVTPRQRRYSCHHNFSPRPIQTHGSQRWDIISRYRDMMASLEISWKFWLMRNSIEGEILQHEIGRLFFQVIFRWNLDLRIMYNLSDFWSIYRTTVWEIITMSDPYPNKTAAEVILSVTRGERPSIPETCDGRLAHLMTRELWRHHLSSLYVSQWHHNLFLIHHCHDVNKVHQMTSVLMSWKQKDLVRHVIHTDDVITGCWSQSPDSWPSFSITCTEIDEMRTKNMLGSGSSGSAPTLPLMQESDIEMGADGNSIYDSVHDHNSSCEFLSSFQRSCDPFGITVSVNFDDRREFSGEFRRHAKNVDITDDVIS